MGDVFKVIFGAIGGPLIIVLGILMMVFVFNTLGVNVQPILAVAIALTPIWLPITLWYLMYDKWVGFVHTKFRVNNPRVTLRIKLPPEVFRSPEAMESVFTHIFAANGSDNLMQAYIDGKHPLVASFEIASIGGDVRFYINVHRKLKDMLESQLYAVYPGIEVTEELIDYAAEVRWNPDVMALMSFHIVKKNASVYPIKTYIDFGHDKLPKEEEKFEPMAALIEHLGKAKPHERLYIQILCTPHAKKDFKSGSRVPSGTWDKEGKSTINEILQRDDKRQSVNEETENRPALTMGERDTVSAIERNISKLAYEVGIRAMYLTTDKTKFDGNMIGPLLGSFKQYGIIGRNELGPRWKTEFDYKFFEDRSGRKQQARMADELEQLKARVYDPGGGKQADGHAPKVMSTEELATIYHIPGSSIITPNLARIASKRREAPGNLPIGVPPHMAQ